MDASVPASTRANSTIDGAPFSLDCERPWLIATFAETQRMVSWSLNRPGLVEADRVAWLEVHNEELRSVADPVPWFQHRLAARGVADAVGLMTARNVARHEHASTTIGTVRGDCVVTLGLNNGEYVGRRIEAHLHPLNAGTINILCAVSVPLSDAALMEAASLAAQARTIALVEIGYRRPGRDEIVTGTGTDCIVLSSPTGANREAFAGMHTAVGEAIGDCVFRATLAAARVWLGEREPRPR